MFSWDFYLVPSFLLSATSYYLHGSGSSLNSLAVFSITWWARAVYVAIIFLRNMSLSLTHLSVYQSQSRPFSGISTSHIRVQENNFLTFPLKNYSKTPEGLVGWAKQSSLVFQAWLSRHSFKFSYLPGRTRSGIKCIVFKLSQSLLHFCYECVLLVCLFPCRWNLFCDLLLLTSGIKKFKSIAF